MFFKTSKQSVWWLCQKCDYEWREKIINYTKTLACPKCKSNQKKKITNKDISLSRVNSALAAQWHPTKNNELTPDMFSAGSGQKVWWVCDFGHEWQATIVSRNKGSGCPYCKSQTSFPEQAIYYYMKQVFPDTINRYTELGFEIDVYIPSIKTAIEYDGIRFHKEKKKIEEVKNQRCKNDNINLIRIREPGLCVYNECVCLIRDDDYSNNSLTNIIKVLFVVLGIEKYDVDVDRDQAQILETYKCLIVSNSIAILNPEIAAEWHPTKNGNLKPKNFTPGSNFKAWWICKKCNHEWQTQISNRTKGKSNCPYCSNKKIISGFNDLKSQNYFLANEWHPTLNGDLTPDKVSICSGKKVWWKCSDCGYEWNVSVANRTNGTGCPCCANRVVVPGINDLATKYPNTAKFWHPTKNGELTPNMFAPGSHKKVWWLCPKCGYEWECKIEYRINGCCPRCVNQIITPGINDLQTKFPNIALQWHPTKNNELTPNMFSAGSSKKVWWLCDKCSHEWQAQINNRTHSKVARCPKCK